MKRCLIVFFACFFAVNVWAQYENSLMWEVTGNGLEQPSYLYGTMHLQDERVFGLEDLIKEKLETCDALALELVTSEAEMGGMNMEMMSMVMMEEGIKLSDLMSKSDYRKVKKLTVEGFEKMMPSGTDLGPMAKVLLTNMLINRVKPLFISSIITAGQSNADRPVALDMHLQNMATEMEKKLIGIETVDEQMGAINRIPVEDQAKMLVEQVNNMEQSEKELQMMIEAYQQQDLNLIDSLSESSGETEGQSFEDELLVKRNDVMAERIDSIYQEQSTFVAVGAAHLVTKNGLINQLREMGYTVKAASVEGMTSESTSPKNDFEQLCDWMTGSFNSMKQSQEDTTYYSINLEMYPIWEDKDDEVYWMYVEQALSSKKEKPYRQRIYKVEQKDSTTFVSSIYTLADPEKYIGSWTKPELYDALSMDSILIREGCEVVLKKEGDMYSGETGDGTCSSTMRGATYATSEVTVTKDGIISWDRGFDKEGKQVWGAEKAGYIFDKVR